MRISTAAAALCLALCFPGQAGVAPPQKPQAKPPQAKPNELVARLEKTIPQLMAEGDVPGLSVALIEDSKIFWSRGFGVKNANTKEPVAETTVFEAASLSKPVVAYAVLKLADQGKLDLNAPLSKYLPAPYIENDQRLDLITARRVLSHTSGFPNWRPDGKPLVIHFLPGERFSYSGEGFVYLGTVVERLTGVPLDEFLAKTALEPLGMKDSSYVWLDRYETQSATGHGQGDSPTPKWKPKKTNPASSLHTTALDYARFLIAVMKGTGLKPETQRAMLTTQSKVDEGCSNCIGRPLTRPSESLFWGLGVGLQHKEDGDSFWHWGDNGNFRCFAVAYPRQKKGIAIFTNSANGLAIAPQIVAEAMQEKQPATAWIKYDPYNSPAFTLFRTIQKEGIEAALRGYRTTKEALNESAMNQLGYRLLGRKQVKEAIAIFKLNVEAFPKSSNVYDSLGEACMVNGDKELAILNYEKSVQLNPANTSGIEALKKLKGE